jgi:hypothetical protein
LLDSIVLKANPNRNEVATSVMVNIVRFIVYKIKFPNLNFLFIFSTS